MRTDDELFAAYTSRGDREALGELFARHAGLLYTVALRHLGDGALAQDVVQETCLRAAQHAAERKPEASVKHWLLRIAVNRAADTARRERRLRSRHAARAAHAQTPLDHELLAAVEERIAQLDDDAKTPLILHYYDSMTQQEIATLLGCSQKTVHQRLQHALEQLRVSLAQGGYACAAPAVAAVLAQSTLAPAPAPLLAALHTVASTAALPPVAAGAAVVGGTLMSVKQVVMISTVLCVLSLGLGYIGHEAVEQITGSALLPADHGFDAQGASANGGTGPATRFTERERQLRDEIAALGRDLAAERERNNSLRDENAALLRETRQLRLDATGESPSGKEEGAAILAALTPEQRKQLENAFTWIQQARPDVYAGLPLEDFVMQEYVCLNDTLIGPEYRANLSALKLLPKLNSINFAGALLGDDDLRALEGITLINLYVHDTTLTDEGVRWMTEHFPNLQTVTLANTRLTDKGLEALAMLSQLRSLLIWNCDVTDAGLAHLARLTQLETLNLTGCSKISDAGMPAVTRLTNLTELSIAGTNVTDAGIASLGELRSLEALTISHNTRITGTGLAQLGATRLRSLSIADSTVTFDALKEALAVLGNLTQINAKNTTLTEQDLNTLRQLYPNVAIMK